MRFRSLGRRSVSAAARNAHLTRIEALEDRRLLSVSLASQGPGGVPAAIPGVPAANPAISDDGRFVVFASSASNLVAGDDNNVADIFVRDRTSGTTTLVSAT